jgi:hypothetical protein
MEKSKCAKVTGLIGAALDLINAVIKGIAVTEL